MALSNLFSPIKLGNVEIKNRCAMAPMGVGFYSPDETWPKKEIRYFEERAMGGIGLIITPFTRVHGKLAAIPLVGIWNDRFIPSHEELVKRVHKHGAKVFLQLALFGGKLSGEAPSSIYSPNYPAKPRALTTLEIDGLVESFIKAAGRGIKAGYDGVEIHGAHSYFIGSMMSPALNMRTDKYGGDFDKRMKFPTDVIKGILNEYPDINVGFKFSAYEELSGGVDIPLGKKIAKHIESLGIAYLHVASTASTMDIMSKYPSVPPMYIPRNTLIPLAEGIKKECPGAVVIGTGSITVPGEADEFISKGQCDMVALGRTVLADPRWPDKAKNGGSIVPCIRCNVCYFQLWLEEPICCTMNPYLLRENEQELPIPARKKKIMVVGAGPAGIQCTVTAAKRGHYVTLYEKNPFVGGMVYPGSKPDCKMDLKRALEWFERELSDCSATLKLNTFVTPEMVEEENPDSLVIATGGEPDALDVPGIEKNNVVGAVDVLSDLARYSGNRAVVVGGGDVGCETACYLADNGFEVTIIEILPKLMETNNNTNVKVQMFSLLEEKNITIMTDTKVNAVTDEGVEVILPTGKHWGIGADLIVTAVGNKHKKGFKSSKLLSIAAKSGLVAELAMKAEEVHLIGDCNSPGSIHEAIEAGEQAGRWI